MATTIIHPTDFSACAEKAMQYAIQLCQHFDAELLLIHTLDPSKLHGHELSASTMRTQSKKLETEARTKLNDLGNAIANQHRLKCRAQLYQGKLINWFSQKVNDIKPLLVVMGTTGAGSLGNQLFGSTTYSMIQAAKGAVLSVP
jgi:nucleotide-binding universal stress UspA family protein